MFLAFSLPTNLAIFVASAAAVWIAGSRLARHADAIAEKTGIGRAVIGILLLGSVTSLPELAVGVTAAIGGIPLLSVNDLLGSAAINVLILALADAALGRAALTSTPGSPGVLLQGVLGIVLLGIVAAAVVSGDVLVFGIGGWSWVLLGAYAAAAWIITRSTDTAWVPRARPPLASDAGATAGLHALRLRRLVASTVVAAVVILAAGFLLATTAEAIAEQTGLGVSFFGSVFLAAATSLPEVSTVLAAMRLRRYEMAIADVFGTNLFNVTIIVVVDALYTGAPVLGEAGLFAAFGALLAIVMTALYVVGMLERSDRTFFRMGFDSLAATSCTAPVSQCCIGSGRLPRLDLGRFDGSRRGAAAGARGLGSAALLAGRSRRRGICEGAFRRFPARARVARACRIEIGFDFGFFLHHHLQRLTYAGVYRKAMTLLTRRKAPC